MTNRIKCLKNTDPADAVQAVVCIGENAYTLQAATEEEIQRGIFAQNNLQIERQYMVHVCGPDAPRGYWDRRSEMQSIPFEELIFCDGDCIGVYHEECVMIFADERTHERKKWLGEMITGPDRSVDIYDYYYLRTIDP